MRVLARMDWAAAGLLAFLLPFTSFPLLGQAIGSSMVAPLSLLPMLALLFFFVFPYLLRGGTIPVQTLPVWGFVFLALLSCAAAFFLPFPPYKSATLIRSELEAVATLAVGIGFYLVILVWAADSERLRFLLRWINWGGVLMLIWTAAQAVIFRLNDGYPEWMWQVQGHLSSSLLLYYGRVNGLAYEPSWMAHQLNMLYLPIWLAAVVTGVSAHRFRIWKIHFEHFLLLGGVAALGLTISRIGWLTFLLVVAYLLLLLNIRLVRWGQRKLVERMQSRPQAAQFFQRWFVVLSVVVLLVVYAGLLIGAAIGLQRVDVRMQKMFDFSTLQEGSLLHFANQLVFAERLVFWEAGWGVFNDYPVIGVGLGNAGYFFPEKLSPFSWALTEVRMLAYRWTNLPNIKSLWVRLLAETGIFGFAMFLTWCYLLWKSARHLAKLPDRLLQMVGLTGAFAVIAFLIEGFSIDTFALPYYWVSFGIITAAVGIVLRSRR